ncbi:MAG: hypothetical protein IJM97_01485 [Clostridia bacterium]|nr:hypothetical protein [Clostridia bacterium]
MDNIEKAFDFLLKEYEEPTISDVIAKINLSLSQTDIIEFFNKVITHFRGSENEDDVWDQLLSMLSPNNIPDEVLEYLIEKKIALMQLCHMDLSDKWLEKLSEYDDAPIYTMFKRYYLSDNYSEEDFANFYQKYISAKYLYISMHFLGLYTEAKKRKLLLSLCANDDEIEDKNELELYMIAEQIKTTTDEKAILKAYEKYNDVGIVLQSIAKNHFAPCVILSELCSIKGVKNAASIRKISKETLKTKQSTK